MNKLMPYIGTVPREFIYLDSLGVHDTKVKDINTLLETYKEERIRQYIVALTKYMSIQTNEELFLSTLLEALVGIKGSTVLNSFLDLSLVYVHSNIRNQYQAITPVAFTAIMRYLNNKGLSSGLHKNQVELLDHTKSPDEKSRAFERVWKEMLTCRQSVMATTSKLDGTDSQNVVFECNAIFNFDTKLFKPCTSTLFVPINASFPVADFLLISPNKAVVFQLTLSDAFAKVPNDKENSYSAVYDTVKFENLAEVKKGVLPPGRNFAESILTLTDFPKQVKLHNHNLVTDPDEKDISSNFLFIVVTPQPVLHTPQWKQAAVNFPWIRVIHQEYLENLLPFLKHIS